MHIKDDRWSIFNLRDFSVMWLFIVPKVQKKHNDLKIIGPCAFYRVMSI